METKRDQELATLFVLAQKGDQQAYERFLLQASQVLRGFLAKRMEESDMIEDVLQDTLLTIHRARHSYSPGRPIGPWLYAICHHRMTDFFRKFRRLQKNEVFDPDFLEQVASQAGKGDGGPEHLVIEALGNLPERQRQVIELLKVQDFSVKEVATRLGISESAVKVTAFRGYETIRRLFGVKQK